VTQELVKAVDEALFIHELIKVKFMEFKEEKKDLIAEICTATASEAVGLVGNVSILFRQNPDEDKRKISVPEKRGKKVG